MQINKVVGVRTADLMTQAVEADLIILNLEHNHYITLDAVGRRIWDLLVEPRSVGDLCRQLGQEFAGAPEQIRADVLAFLDELVSERLAAHAWLTCGEQIILGGGARAQFTVVGSFGLQRCRPAPGPFLHGSR